MITVRQLLDATGSPRPPSSSPLVNRRSATSSIVTQLLTPSNCKALAVATGRRPGRLADRPGVALPVVSGHRRPRPVLERVRGDRRRAGRDAVVHRHRDRGRRRDVPGRVARDRAQRVRPGRRGGACPSWRSTARRVLRAQVRAVEPELHADHADVVGRGRGHRRRAANRRLPARARSATTIGAVVSPSAARRLRRRRAAVAGRVLGEHAVAVRPAAPARCPRGLVPEVTVAMQLAAPGVNPGTASGGPRSAPRRRCRSRPSRSGSRARARPWPSRPCAVEGADACPVRPSRVTSEDGGSRCRPDPRRSRGSGSCPTGETRVGVAGARGSRSRPASRLPA